MNFRLFALTLGWVSLLAACSTPSPGIARQAPSPAAVAPAQLSMDLYKRQFAQRVAHESPDMFHEPLPKMFKSIVVLDVTISRDGRLAHVAVHRSNGYKDLERIALANVRRAAPFSSPPHAASRSDGSVNFLETFLFRDDGRFQIRSLLADAG